MLLVGDKQEDNILRNTLMGYSAVVGGADGVEVRRHDIRNPVEKDKERQGDLLEALVTFLERKLCL